MRMNVEYFENEIVINNDYINVIELENKNYFFRFVNDIYKISNKDLSEQIVFYDENDIEINANDKIRIYLNFFDFDFNSKKYTSDFIKHVNENVDEDNKRLMITQYKKLMATYKKILNNVDIPLYVDTDLNFESIIKNYKISVVVKPDLLSNIFLLIDIEKVLGINRLLFFINLKQYLTKKELIEVYKYAIYNHIKIILVDSQCYGVTLKYEKKYIIDDNLDEFVL